MVTYDFLRQNRCSFNLTGSIMISLFCIYMHILIFVSSNIKFPCTLLIYIIVGPFYVSIEYRSYWSMTAEIEASYLFVVGRVRDGIVSFKEQRHRRKTEYRVMGDLYLKPITRSMVFCDLYSRCWVAESLENLNSMKCFHKVINYLCESKGKATSEIQKFSLLSFSGWPNKCYHPFQMK